MTSHVVLKTKPFSPENTKFTLSKADDTLTITHAAGASTTVSVSDVVAAGGILVLYWSPVNDFVYIPDDVSINSVGTESYIRYSKAANKTLAAFISNPEQTDFVGVIYEGVIYDGAFSECFYDCATAQAVDLVFPGYSTTRLAHRHAKSSLLTKIGTHESLSSLEKQVDMLTRLVLDLIGAQSGQYPSAVLLNQLLADADANAGKEPGQTYEKIKSFKTKLRAAQAAYFAERG
jgi:hypothetical protein